MAGVSFSSNVRHGCLVVALSGDLDVRQAADTVSTLTAAAAADTRIIVDLAGLTFLDCAGLAALVSVRKQARQAGGELLLAAPSQQVARLLFLTGLIAALPVSASVAEAIDSARRTSRPSGREGSLAGRGNVPRAL